MNVSPLINNNKSQCTNNTNNQHVRSASVASAEQGGPRSVRCTAR